jgi:hypothetical protein
MGEGISTGKNIVVLLGVFRYRASGKKERPWYQGLSP